MKMSVNTFDVIFDNICKKLKRNLEVETFSTQFSLLENDEQRFTFVAPLLDDYNFFKELEHTKKSEITSTKLREEGNRLFAKKKDLEALDFYTQSLCFAPLQSQSLTLAFANRSAVLKSLCYYSDCIKDIRRSLLSKYPENLEYKLHIREGECLIALGLNDNALDCFILAKKKLQRSDLPIGKIREIEKNLENHIISCENISNNTQEESYEITVPQVSYGENAEILCASDSIELKYSKEMGRHIVAARDINPGDVLAVEKSYAAVLLSEFIHSHCSDCMKRCTSLLPCTKCTMAMYCSEECRQTSFEKYHKLECDSVPALTRLDMGKMALLAARILTFTGPENILQFVKNHDQMEIIDNAETRRTVGFTNGKYNSLEFSPIYHLITNTALRIVPDLFKRSLMAVCILKCLKLDTLPPDSVIYGGLLLRLLQSLPCNAHEVSELCKSSTDKIAHSVEIGGAAYATLSLLNHSCDPNVVRHSHGTTAVLRAIKSVPKGTEILDNYGYHYAVHSIELRQHHLKNQYLFNCSCVACCDLWPLHEELPTRPNKNNIPGNLNDAFNDAINYTVTDDALPQFLSHLKKLDSCGERLCQEYNCCQEAIKQYFATHGNYHQYE